MKLASLNTNQLDRPTTATEDLELTSVMVEPTASTKTTTTTKLTTKKSSVTNHLNVTNSISVNLTKPNILRLVSDVPSHVGVENQTNSNLEHFNQTAIDYNGVVVISISIHLRIIGDGFNATQAYDNSIEHDDDSGDNDDGDDDVDVSYSDSYSVTESYRQKRDSDLSTRPSIQHKSWSDNTKDSDSYNNDYNFDSLDTKLSQHIREARQVTTRRPSHHYRSTSKFVLYLCLFLSVLSLNFAFYIYWCL